MPDQDPNQDSDDRSILDSDDSADEEASSSVESTESSSSSPLDDEQDPMAQAQETIEEDPDSAAEEEGATATAQEPSDDAEESKDVEELHFEDENVGELLRHASEEQLDEAPFGIVRVDDEGLVEFYNQYESDLSGMDPDEVMGRNFFTQVAPCTNNRLFRGRFKKGVRRGELDETYTYTFTYKMRPTLVDVHLYRDEAGNNWILIQKY